MTAVVVENITSRAPGEVDRAAGVVAFVHAAINGMVVDGITIRRGRDGTLRLGFPKHRDRYDRVHAVVRPTDDAVRQAITRQVLAALGLNAAATDSPAHQGGASP